MRAHAHLRLVVSEPDEPADSGAAEERTSMVQPVSALEVWVRKRQALWLASAVLAVLAALAGALLLKP
jgi:hypothetical protein